MDARDEELVKKLAPTNVALRRLVEKHARLKAEVDELSSLTFRTADEEKRRRLLQKQKLAEKDRIVRMLEEYRRENGEASSGS
jgi:uncharacterized protein YdcH (DUF465 family)